MKIVEITHALSSGGGERLKVDLSNRLVSNPDNEVYMIVTRSLKKPGNDHYLPFLSKKIKLVELNAPYGFSFKEFWAMFKSIASIKPDVVHSHGALTLLVLPSLFFPKIKFYNTIHTLPSRLATSKLNKLFSKFLYKHLVTPVTISKECHKDYQTCYGLTNDKLITNGSETLQNTSEEESVTKEIDSYKKNSTTPIFIHVARAHPVKNHKRLFETFKRLDNEGFDFELVIVGTGYECYSDELKFCSKFHFVGEKQNVGDYMACADFFTLTSDKEGLPISLLEAMSMGVIPVCTPAGGIVDVIENRRNGFIAANISDEDYYECVKEALSDKYPISKEIIKEEFNSKFSMETCASNYYNLFSSTKK